MDQQDKLEKAFSSPYVLAQRLGHVPTVQEIADFDPDALIAIFATPPALHRFPKAMAGRVQEVCRALVDRYDGDAANLWKDADSGAELVKRVASLPGFGKQKSQIFTALLGKQFGVQPRGLAGGGRLLRRGRLVPVGGRHRRRAARWTRCGRTRGR